jgi:hypothetical protein
MVKHAIDLQPFLIVNSVMRLRIFAYDFDDQGIRQKHFQRVLYLTRSDFLPWQSPLNDP